MKTRVGEQDGRYPARLQWLPRGFYTARTRGCSAFTRIGVPALVRVLTGLTLLLATTIVLAQNHREGAPQSFHQTDEAAKASCQANLPFTDCRDSCVRHSGGHPQVPSWGIVADCPFFQVYVADFFFPASECPAGSTFQGPFPGQCVPDGGPTLAGAGKNGGPDPTCVGNPCNPATGNKYQAEEDYRSGDGLLVFTRHYNSQFRGDVGLGFGWTSTVHRRLVVDGTSVRVHQRTGRDEPFLCAGGGACVGDADTKLLLDEDPIGYTLTLGNGTSERYDLDGRLLFERDHAGKITTYSYDANGHLLMVVSPFGHTLTFVHSADGHMIGMTDPAGGAYTYVYDTNENLVQVTYADDAVRTYHYEDSNYPHHLTGITDENGDRFATYAYDANGKAILTEHAGGQERFTLTYDSESQTTVTDAAGTDEVLTFEEKLEVKNLLRRINQKDSKGLVQEYDDQNNLARSTDAEGRITAYTHNADNQRLTMTEAAGTPEERTTTFTYVSDDTDLVTEVITPSVAPGRLKRVTTTYDANNNPIQMTQSGFMPSGDPVSRTITMQYNTMGQVTQIDGPRTDVTDITTLEYYECTTGVECGQLKRVTNAVGHATTYDSYDAHGRVTQLTNPNGIMTAFTYDRRGRVTSVTLSPPTGPTRTTINTYDAAGQLRTVTTPDGIKLEYAYDAAHDLRSISDNTGNGIEYDYDLRGNRIVERTLDPDGTLVRVNEQSYDIRNRLREINTAGSTTQMINDAVGNLVSQTDPNANPPTRHSYDSLDRLFETLDALGGVTGYGYDVNDRITRVRAPNDATTQYLYDDLGNLLEERSPDRGTLAYTYDEAGNISTLTDARGIETTYAYDALNRIATIDYPDAGEDIAFTYDACPNGIGRLCTVQDESGTTRFVYDAYGNVTEQLHTELGVDYRTAYTYDAGDRIVRVTYPNGRLVTYTRDVLGRITQTTTTVEAEAKTPLENVVYRADGLITGQVFGNGLGETRVYDQQGRLMIQFLGTADTRVYSYDPNGNLISKQTLPLVGTYGYDPLDRLTEESLTNGSVETRAYGYDPNGNRLNRTKGANNQSYTYVIDSNRLESVNGREIVLDPAGNALSDRNGRRRFEYNQAGRLVRFFRRNELRGVYTYNFQGQRTRKVRTNNTGVTKTFVYHYDISGNLIAESREDGKPIRDYIWVDNAPVAQVKVRRNKKGVLKERRLLYLHTDHLNTPRLATDDTQTVVWRWEGDAFGQMKPEKDPDEDDRNTNVRLRFPGQYHDGESALYYNWNRYYDPRTGRYISSDPVGLKAGRNTYTYASNDPMRLNDPTGLAIWICNRQVRIPPYIGNHSYYWNDSNGQCCGRNQGQDPLLTCKELGPASDACVMVPGSDDKEQQIMSCCQKRANEGLWMPFTNDCHDSIERCLKDTGLASPGIPGGRLGPCKSCWDRPEPEPIWDP